MNGFCLGHFGPDYNDAISSLAFSQLYHQCHKAKLRTCGAHFPTISELGYRRIPAIPRSSVALWPSGWRLSFHISITSIAFCIWTRVWFLPLLQPPTPSLLHPSIAADRFLKRSERRWAEQATVLPYLAIRIWAALSQQCSDSYRCGS